MSDATTPPPSITYPAVLAGADEAAAMLGIGTRKLWELTKINALPHRRIGTRVLYPVRELIEWAGSDLAADPLGDAQKKNRRAGQRLGGRSDAATRGEAAR